MIVLSINTTGVGTQICLNIDNKIDCVDAGFSRHSEAFFTLLQDLLDRNNVQVNALDYVGVVTGPGSFTGIRIGMSVAKAFCYTNNIPCIGVNSLQVLAYNIFELPNIQNGQIVCATINAGADMVYYQFFEVQDKIEHKLKTLSSPDACKIEYFYGLVKKYYDNAIVLYNGSNEKDTELNNSIQQVFTPIALNYCVMQSLNEGNVQNQNMVMPLYIRGAQAELITISDMNNLIYKKATIDDLNILLELESQKDVYDLPWNEQNIIDMLHNDRANAILIEYNGQILGYIVYLDIAGQYEIERIVVKRSARLQGLGKRLIEFLITQAKEHNVGEILLEVNYYNYPAYRLYTKMGFVENGKRKDYYGKGVDAILMTKQI